MSKENLELALRAANPVAGPALAALDLGGAEEALGRALMNESSPGLEPGGGGRGRRPRAWRSWRALLGAAAAAAIGVAIVVLSIGGGGGGPGSATPAYGAELVRYAESGPLLLLEEPDWHVRSITELKPSLHMPLEGRMEFVEGSGTPGPRMTRSDVKQHRTPPAVRLRRQRRAELEWYDASQVRVVWRNGRLGKSMYDEYLGKRVTFWEPGHAFKTTIPSLGATAFLAPRTETSWLQGGPGDRAMTAIWEEDGLVLELRASVPNLSAFEDRLGWLRRVGAEAWLDAMPAKVVKAAEYEATVQAMLVGIPLPPGFDPTSIPNLGLTTNRYQVGAEVGGAVACAWFRHWGEARADHDAAAAREAEQVLLESEAKWPIFREMSKEGAYPATIVEYARTMHTGSWFGKPLLQAVNSDDGLCASG